MPTVILPTQLPASAPALHLLDGLRLGSGFAGGAAIIENRYLVQAVLALVGSARRGMARDELVELLWPQSSAAAGRNRLYHTVHLARLALASVSWDDEWVVVRNSRVLLDERVWCDVDALTRAGERSSAELSNDELQALVLLCSGDWMPKLQIGTVGDGIRARVSQAQCAILREAIARGLIQGDTPALRALLQRLLQIHSTDEWAHRELMKLDLAAGRRHAVLRTFETLSREISVKLGLRPSAQTVAIASAATAELQSCFVNGSGDSRPARVGIDSSSHAANSLVGREALIQDLVGQMSRRAGLWNFTGLSGIGKTTLALEVARRMAPSMADGVFVVSLGDLGAYETAASACARALGLAATEQSDEASMIVHAVQARNMLLILDDVDAAHDAESLLTKLPLHSLRARVIVTTRAKVKLQHSAEVAVPLLQTPATGATLDQGMQSDSFALFQMRCPVASHELQSKAWQVEAVQLMRRLEGLPLAIELAAARTAIMTPGEILSQIERTLRPLGDGPLDKAGRHRSLQASLDWSVGLLSEGARKAYGAASVFPAGFARGDLCNLMPAVGLSVLAGDAFLDELIAAGLLARVQDGQLLRMLHLLQAHARAQAQAYEHWPQVVAARMAEVCRRLEASPLVYESPDYARHLVRVIDLEDDAVALLEHAHAHDAKRFVQLLVPLCESWTTRGASSRVVRWVQLGIECARALGRAEDHLWMHANWVLAVRREGRLAAAEQLSQSLMPLCDDVSDSALVAFAIDTRATALQSTGKSQKAVKLLSETLTRLDLREYSPGFWTLHTSLWNLGSSLPGIKFDLGSLRKRFAGSCLWPDILRTAFATWPVHDDYESLRAIADDLLESAQGLRSQRTLLDGIWRKAACHLGLDESAEALLEFDEYYRIARDMGWSKGAAHVKRLMVSLYLRTNDFNAATACQTQLEQAVQSSASDASSLAIPLLRAKAQVLGGQVTEAVKLLDSIAQEVMLTSSDEDLVEWSEVTALVADLTGQRNLASVLALSMRRLDRSDDHFPIIRRFRDLHFGQGEALTVRTAEELEDLRTSIREGLTEFYRLIRPLSSMS